MNRVTITTLSFISEIYMYMFIGYALIIETNKYVNEGTSEDDESYI